MAKQVNNVQALAQMVADVPRRQKRRLIAVCGAPASGKSTLADALCAALQSNGVATCVVPMDGFHLDNTILKANGSLDRKGAPHTFDSAGFAALIARCGHEDDVYYPTFDRARDIAIAASGVVTKGADTVVVEGNYLLMQTSGWRDLASLWDITITLDVPAEELRNRLIKRWTDHGLSPRDAAIRAEQNDMKNARTVIIESAPADVIYAQDATDVRHSDL